MAGAFGEMVEFKSKKGCQRGRTTFLPAFVLHSQPASQPAKKFFLTAILFILFHFFNPSSAFAASGITYQGRLLKPNGLPVTDSNVQFRLQIRTPGAEDCLLYEEIQSQNLSTTNGMFAISLGDGSGVRQDTHLWNLFESLSNRKNFSFSSSDCLAGNSYHPSPTDNRKFRVFFNDGSFAGWEALPIQTINFIPMSIESYAVGGFPASSLLRFQDASGNLVNTSPLDNDHYAELLLLLDGNSTHYTKAGQLNGHTIPALGNGDVLSWNGTGWTAVTPLTSFTEQDPSVEAFAKSALPVCDAGEALAPNSLGTALECVTVGGAASLPDQSVTPGSYAKVTINQKGIVTAHGSLDEADIPQLTGVGNGVDGGAITSGEIGGTTSVNTSGAITTSAALSANTATITGSTTSGSFSSQQFNIFDSDNSNYIRIQSPSDVPANYTLTFPPALGSANQVLGMNAAGTALENKSLAAGSGITITHNAHSIEISADGSGTVTSVTGTAPIQVDNTNAATPVVSVDTATTTDSGVVTLAADGGITAGTVVQGNDSRLSNSRPPSGTAGGDLSGTYPDPTVVAVRGVAVSATTPTEDGHVLRYNTSNYAPGFLSLADIRSTVGPAYVTAFPATSCLTSQTLTWSSLTDTLSCADIEIEMSQISDYTSLWTENSGDVYRATGNVGIGTTNPTTALDVNGIISINGQRIINYTSALGVGTQSMFIGSGGMSNTGNYNVAVGDGALVDNSTGSNNTAVGTNTLLKNTSGGRNTAFGLAALRNIITSSNNTAIGWGAGRSTVADGVDSNVSSSNSVYIGHNVRPSQDGNTNEIIIGYNADGIGSNTVVLGDDNIVTTALKGNVGIGTTNPTAKLEVDGTIKATAFEGPMTSTSTSLGDGSAASPSLTFSNNNNTGFYSSGANQIGISAGGTKVWDLTTSGIISPTAGGAAVKTSAGTAAAPTFSFAGDEDTGWFRPAENNLAAATGGVERIRIDENGNVGIGTTSLTGVLTVQKNQNASTPVNIINTDTGPAAEASFLLGSANVGGTYGFFSYYGSGYTPNGARQPRRTLLSGQDIGGLGLMAGSASGSMVFTVGGTGDAHERMTILPNGNVGIGTTAPTHKLQVDGTAGLSTGTAWTNTSDERLKDIHGKYEHGLNEIKLLSTVNFSYKKDNPLGLPSDKVITGFIAQDVQKIIPEAVITREDGYLELNVDPIHWATVNAVQELAEMCEMSEEQQLSLKSRVDQHHQEIEKLKAENQSLQREVSSLKERLDHLERLFIESRHSPKRK